MLEDYLNINNFDLKDDNSDLEYIEKTKRKIDKGNTIYDAITHYMSKYGFVPTWVATKTLSFGTISEYIFNYVQGTEIHFSKYASYAFAYRIDDIKVNTSFPAYIDCFPGTIYHNKFAARQAEECQLRVTTPLINKSYITLDEATYILRESNTVYLPALNEGTGLKRKLVKIPNQKNKNEQIVRIIIKSPLKY